MKTKIGIAFVAALVFSIIQTSTVLAAQKTAILIIAHGSRSAEWNASVLRLEKAVSDRLASKSVASKARVAFMEMAKPTIADVIRELKTTGVEQIFAVPLFINPSGHSVFDVPAILGLYSEKELLQTLHEEEIEIVKTPIKIVLGPTLNHGDLVQQILLDRVKELSDNPDSEGIVLLTHGSPEFEPFWHQACKDIGAYVCAKTGITKFDYAFVEVGQSFGTNGLRRILRMADRCEKVIVPGLYLSLAPSRIAGRYVSHQELDKDWFTRQNIHFSDKGLLPDDRLVGWIVERVLEWTAPPQPPTNPLHSQPVRRIEKNLVWRNNLGDRKN
jgi:predicted peroxiredoxin